LRFDALTVPNASLNASADALPFGFFVGCILELFENFRREVNVFVDS
jgi:hypothetical protein